MLGVSLIDVILARHATRAGGPVAAIMERKRDTHEPFHGTAGAASVDEIGRCAIALETRRRASISEHFCGRMIMRSGH